MTGKRILSLIALLLAVSLLPLVAGAEAGAEEYVLLTAEYGETVQDAAAMGTDVSFRLVPDGSGVFRMNGQELPITWVREEGLTLTQESGDSILLTAEESGYCMQMGENYYWHFVPESVAGKPSTLMQNYFSQIDGIAGAHLKYGYSTDYLNADVTIDVQTKGIAYYSRRDTQVKGLTNSTITCYLDGAMYNLDPDKKTGIIATTVSPEFFGSRSVLAIDKLYGLLSKRVNQRTYTEETREANGVSAPAIVYPADSVNAETVFWFDEAGNLLYVLEGAPVIAPDMGETFYTVLAVDTNVDPSLFSIEGYTIGE